MKLDISNLSNANRRIRLVPKEGATITLPETAVNPTVMFEDTGALVYCLSPKPPVLGISCDGATDRSGKLSFDGPVIFKLEPDGEVIQFANEAEFVAWIKAHPETGLTVKDYNRPTYEMILPISTVPGEVDSDQDIYPTMAFNLLIVGKDQTGTPLSMSWNGELFGDSMEYPANSIKRTLREILFPMNGPGVGDDIVVTTTRIDEVSELNTMLFKDALVTHLPMVADLSGNVKFTQGATDGSESNYDMAMYGINVDLSAIKSADVTANLNEYFLVDSGSEDDKPWYFSVIDKIIFAAPSVYSLGSLGSVQRSQQPQYDRQDAPHYPYFANALLTSNQVIHQIGGEVEFSADPISVLEPVNGNAHYFDNFTQVERWEERLEAGKYNPDRTVLMNGPQQISTLGDLNALSVVQVVLENVIVELTKIQLPQVLQGETLRIKCPVRFDLGMGMRRANGQLIFPGIPLVRKNDTDPNDYAGAYSPVELIHNCLSMGTLETLEEGGNTTVSGYVDYTPTHAFEDVPVDDQVIYMLNYFNQLEFSIITLP